METGKAKMLRVYLSNTDKFRHAPLYEVIVFAAKRAGLSGATVLKGIMGYGSSSVIHSQKFWEISEKIPLVIEIIDESAKIDAFTSKLTGWMSKIKNGCLITTEDATIILQKKGTKS
jgi:PII-like signaling protein